MKQRTPKQIAADLRAMAEMLNNAATEIESITTIDPKMLEAIRTLGPLFGAPVVNGGGEPIEEPLPLPKQSIPTRPLIPSRGPGVPR